MLLNLSTTGAYIASNAIPCLGATVAFRFRLPGSTQELELAGLVAWVRRSQVHPIHSLPPGYGISFRELDDNVRHILAAVVAARAGS